MTGGLRKFTASASAVQAWRGPGQDGAAAAVGTIGGVWGHSGGAHAAYACGRGARPSHQSGLNLFAPSGDQHDGGAFDRLLAAQTGRTHGEDHIVLTMTLRLAAAGLLTSAVVIATVGVAAAQNLKLSPSAAERDALLLVAQRSGAPRTPLDTRRPPSGSRVGPGLEIKPEWVPKKKAQIPQPVHCIPAEKVPGLVEVTPMSQLPPPGICTGKIANLKKQVVKSSGEYFGDKSYKEISTPYCFSCKYAGDTLVQTSKVHYFGTYNSPDKANDYLACYRCKAGYAPTKTGKTCCNNPKK